jgi:hypothetical protein
VARTPQATRPTSTRPTEPRPRVASTRRRIPDGRHHAALRLTRNRPRRAMHQNTYSQEGPAPTSRGDCATSHKSARLRHELSLERPPIGCGSPNARLSSALNLTTTAHHRLHISGAIHRTDRNIITDISFVGLFTLTQSRTLYTTASRCRAGGAGSKPVKNANAPPSDWLSRTPPGAHPARHGRKGQERTSVAHLRTPRALPVSRRRGSGLRPGRPAR